MSKAEHLMMVGARDAGYKDEEDFYQTPPVATLKLLERWQPKGVVWEPACGYGAISKVLKAKGIKVISTDLVDRGYGFGPMDFLECEEPLANTIITNPPFNISTEFVAHALDLVPQSAFLLRLNCLEGIARFERLYSKCTLKKVLVFVKRLPRMHKEGWAGPKTTSTMAFAWYIFDASYYGNAEVEFLNDDGSVEWV